jgi:prepilin-type N-terminal cleavage/methylation domain-containing protein
MLRAEAKNPNGFTLLEVLVVMVLIAAFFVVALSVFRDHDTARQITGGDVLAAHIRYVQMRSMDTGTSWGIRYDRTENAYWMYRHPDTNIRRPLPGEAVDAVDLNQSGVIIGADDFTLRFDDWGRPCDASAPLAVNLTLDLAMTGKSGLPLTITANTGFVQWQP